MVQTRGQKRKRTNDDDDDDDSWTLSPRQTVATPPQWTEAMAILHIFEDEIYQYLISNEFENDSKQHQEIEFIYHWGKSVRDKLLRQDALIRQHIHLNKRKSDLEEQLRNAREAILDGQAQLRQVNALSNKVQDEIQEKRQEYATHRAASRFLSRLEALKNEP